MTPNDNMATLMAATRVAERLYQHLRDTDPEALKRLLDAAREQLESRLAQPGDADALHLAAARAELALLRRLFEHLA